MELKKQIKNKTSFFTPLDWSKSSLQDIVKNVIDNRGKTPPVSSLGEVELIETASISFVTHIPDLSKITKFVSLQTFNSWFRAHPEPGDILVSTVGEYSGATAMFLQKRGTIAQNLIALRIKPGIDPDYVFYWTRSLNFQNQLSKVMMNQAQPSLRVPWLLGFEIAFPPKLEEQKAIAKALSDVDALIDSLDRLIAKKRDLKQATMQQLLTGKTRLPGFKVDWIPINMALNSTLKARIGWQGLTTDEYLETGQYSLITGTDFCDGKINWGSCHFIEKNRYDQDKNIQVQLYDVLLTKDGTIGKSAFVDELPYPATLNSGVFVIRPKSNSYEPKYFFYVLRSQIFVDFLSRLQAGSTINHLYQKDFVNFEFLAPASIKEQNAIAEVLTEIDTEITTLEKQLKKTLAIKQGMMQELLTGRTRLI